MSNQIQVTEYSPINAALEELKDKYGSVVPDCSSKESYEFSKSIASECRTIRSNLESVRKDKKSYYLEYGRAIDSQAKSIKAAILAIEEPHSEAYKAKDAERKAVLQARKDKISELVNINQWAFGKSELDIEAKIEEVQDMEISSSQSSFGKLANDAIAAQSGAIEALYRCHAEAVNRRIEEEKREAERLELEALRAEQVARDEAERKRKEEEVAKQREAEEARKQAEDRAKQEELARIEAEKQAVIAAKQAAERAANEERQRIEAEQKAEEEAARQREADKKHKAAINCAARDALIEGGLSEKQATRAVELIAMKNVPNVTINY